MSYLFGQAKVAMLSLCFRMLACDPRCFFMKICAYFTQILAAGRQGARDCAESSRHFQFKAYLPSAGIAYRLIIPLRIAKIVMSMAVWRSSLRIALASTIAWVCQPV